MDWSTPSLNATALRTGLWAEERNLVLGATRKDQLTKLVEEMGELAAGLARSDEAKIHDSIGDCFVVLTILALQSGTTIRRCAADAYDEIKDRKGRMENGIFIKEADLPLFESPTNYPVTRDEFDADYRRIPPAKHITGVGTVTWADEVAGDGA